MKLSQQSNFIIFLCLSLGVSYILTMVHFHEQHAVDGGLVLAKKVVYPDNFSPLKDYFLGAWTSINQVSALLFKFNWSVLNVSKFFIFIVSLFYMIGTSSVIYSFTRSAMVSFLTLLVIVIFQKNFGDADYPTLFFSPHTFGALSLAIATSIFGLAFMGYFFLVGFLSTLLISVHPIIGAWICFIIFSSVIFMKFALKRELNTKKLIYGGVAGLFISSFSFFVYLNEGYFSSSNINFEALNNYIKYWEGHRHESKFHFEYLLKTLGLFIFSIYCLIKLKRKINNNIVLGITIVLSNIFFSSIIYITYKFIDFPTLIKLIMPTRFVIMHSVIAWPIILAILFLLIKEICERKRLATYIPQIIIILILSLYTIQHYKSLISLKNYYVKNLKYEKSLSKKDSFWSAVNDSELKGYVLTAGSSSVVTLRKGFKPILLNPDIIDYVPYFPKTALRLSVIIEKIYGIPFVEPPTKIRNRASISDEFIKLNFEKYSKDKWESLAKKYNISALIVPENWNINLPFLKKNNKFAFYIF